MAKTNTGLLAYAKAQLGLPYWYGTFGQIGTAALHTSKKAQYPAYYTASDFPSQYGKRVHDCVGLIKGYLWSESIMATPKYIVAQDKSAAGMYGLATVKGAIGGFPKGLGQLVFRGKPAAKIDHVGVYGGDGHVYEAKGHAYGVVKTAFKASDWSFWAECPYVTYEGEVTAPEAIEYLAAIGVINSPAYWLANYSTLQYLDVLLINAAGKLTAKGSASSTVEAAINALHKAGIISSPAYWRANYGKLEHVEGLIKSLGGCV